VTLALSALFQHLRNLLGLPHPAHMEMFAAKVMPHFE
jgi:hypothetical protein